MARNTIFLLMLVYVIGGIVCAFWATSWHSAESVWSAAGLLGLVLWSSFFGISNALGWVAYWSREHWLG